MSLDQYLTPCQLFFDRKGKDGCRYIMFSLPVGLNVLPQLYKILGQNQVQDNYEGCVVQYVEIGTRDLLEINLSIEDFK